jgi:hypothetical protein
LNNPISLARIIRHGANEGQLVGIVNLTIYRRKEGHCQTNWNRPAKGAGLRRSGRQLTPLGQGGSAVLLEDIAAIEMTFLIEVVVDRGVSGDKLLQGIYGPELRHHSFSSPERLM